jgi:hypothetical protein
MSYGADTGGALRRVSHRRRPTGGSLRVGGGAQRLTHTHLSPDHGLSSIPFAPGETDMIAILHRAFRQGGSFLVTLIAAAATGHADDGWITLFDGQSLAGWHKNPQRIGHGTGGRWSVEDGAIVGEQDPPGSGNGGILLTDRKFADFDLSIDAKPDWGVCSGLFLRANDKGQCFQMMVDYHDAGNVGHVYGEGTGGFSNRPFDIFGTIDPKTKLLAALTARPNAARPPKAYSASGEEWVRAWKLNDYNTLRARVVGIPPKITTWINDLKVSEFDGETFDGQGYNKERVAKTLGKEGSIAVQVHGGGGWPKGAKCRWKNVKIKPL